MDALQARLATLSDAEQDLVIKWQTCYAPLKTATYRISFMWDFAYTSFKRRQDDGDSAISSFTTSYIRTSQKAVTTEEPTRSTTVAAPIESEWEGVCPNQWKIVVEDRKLPDGAGEKCPCKATPSLDDQSPYQPEELDAAIGDFCDGSRTLHYLQTGIPEEVYRDYYLGNKLVLSLGVQFTTLPSDRCKTPP
ncbi:hypothetical protein DER46DRAFT_569959 [Fusarium sp. MPI-SDFR-AT-0072]|nr:hypothetical protein DER46DRAFT_569959 [Fusarium sp. MPI-SDFR-AT-0072]